MIPLLRYPNTGGATLSAVPKTTAINIRFPDDLYERLRDAAEADDRSINSFVVHVVREALRRRAEDHDASLSRSADT